MYIDSYLTELVSTQFRIEYRSSSVFSMVNKDCMFYWKKSVRNKTSVWVSFVLGEPSKCRHKNGINHPPLPNAFFSFITNICDMPSNRLLDRELVDVETSQPVSMGRGDWLQLERISYKDNNNIQRRWERCVRRKERASNIDGIEISELIPSFSTHLTNSCWHPCHLVDSCTRTIARDTIQVCLLDEIRAFY